MFTAEVKARHGCNNPFESKGTLLAIHCVLNPPQEWSVINDNC